MLISIFAAFGQSNSVVSVDSNNVMVLNGRKVFPIALSPGPPINGKTPDGTDALEELRSAGALLFRMTQTNNWNSQVVSNQQAALDWATQHGMYCIVNLRELSKFSSGDTNTEASLRNIVDTFKNHPALGVWKNFDEAWWAGASVADLKRGYDVIKQHDTNHPVEQTHAPRGTISDLQPYNVAADILALDIYPIAIPPPINPPITNTAISQLGDWTQVLSNVANGQKEFWMVEQIAFSGTTPPNKTLVFPTFKEERFMAYEAIVNGARGLMYFGGNIAATLNLQDAPLGWNWTFWNDVLKPVVQQLGDSNVLWNALIAPQSMLPITITGTTFPDIEFCVREVPPYLYILATKREGSATNVTFSGLPSWVVNGEVLYEWPRTVTAINGQFTDTFAPLDVHVYRFSQANQPPSFILCPQSRTNYSGTTATFSVTADGTGPLAFQWRKNGVNLSDSGNIAGATSATLILSEVSQADIGGYDVIVTGFGSITSAPLATLTVVTNQPPILTSLPLSRTNAVGTTATFSVRATGSGPFSYQWRRNGVSLVDDENISGATSPTLSLFSVSSLDTGNYDVVVTGFGNVTSSPPASLTVLGSRLILYEPFDYANVGSAVSSNAPANWAFNGSGSNDLNVASGNLICPGLQPSMGNSVTNGGAGLGTRRLFGTSVTNGAIYFSALFRINDLGYGVWNGAASQVGALTAPDNQNFRLAIMAALSNPTNYIVGVQKGGSGATTTFDAILHEAGETIFLVGKYDFTVSPNRVSLWINPGSSTFGGAEPMNGFVSATNGIDGFAIDRFNMRQNTSNSVPAAMQWDELRFGFSWADVTPPGVVLKNAVRLSDGTVRFAFIDATGQSSSVYASTNLWDWIRVGTAHQTASNTFQFIDTTATNFGSRYYQLRRP